MKREKIVQLLILMLGIMFILVAIVFDFHTDKEMAAGPVRENISLNTVLLSIGCSILAVVIINFVDYHITLPDIKVKEIISKWKLSSIYSTRQEMNSITNSLLLKSSELDIASLGATGLINHQGDILIERLRKGLKIRLLVPIKNSEHIKQQEFDENVVAGSITKGIEDLINWVETAKRNPDINGSNIQIREYSSLPIDSIMRIDKHIFTGPFMVNKKSQLTLAFHFKEGGEGYSTYKDYFDKLWENENFCKEIIRND